MNQPASDVRPASEARCAGWPSDLVEVGRVLGAWGIKGGLKVKPHATHSQALFSAKRWYLCTAEGAPVAVPSGPSGDDCPGLLRIQQAREQGDGIVATAHDLVDRSVAEQLAGARVLVSRGSFPTPAEDEFYWVDLIGLRVVNRDGQDLGRVSGLIETGPHCVLRLQGDPPATRSDPAPASRKPGSRRRAAAGAAAPERLIPFVAAYVDRVDLSAGCVLVDWDLDD